MKVSEFLNNLQNAGYWRENCVVCGKVFDAPEGENLCPKCQKEQDEDESQTPSLSEAFPTKGK